MAKRLSIKNRKRRKDQASAYSAAIAAGTPAKRHKIADLRARRALFRKINPQT
jgi:hypothetical protein